MYPILIYFEMMSFIHKIIHNHVVTRQDNGQPLVSCIPAISNRPIHGGARKKALLIGCNYVHSQNELNGCVNDSVNVASMLHNKEPAFELHILADAGFNGGRPDVEHGVLPPTRTNILNGLEWLVDDAKPGDWLLFHFSGHGVATPLPPNAPTQVHKNHSPAQQVDAIIPPNFEEAGGWELGFIYSFTLRQYIDKLAAGVNMVVIVDACHSGSIADLRYSYPSIDSGGSLSLIKPEINVNLADTEANVYCFSGCLLNQTSADAFLEPIHPRTLLAQGALSHDLLQTIYDTLDKPLSYCDFMRLLHRTMRAHNFDQISLLSTGRPIDTSVECVLYKIFANC